MAMVAMTNKVLLSLCGLLHDMDVWCAKVGHTAEL